MERQAGALRRAVWGSFVLVLAAGCDSGNGNAGTPRIERPSTGTNGSLSVGATFDLQLVAAGTGAMRWAVVVGALPTGLALGADDGRIRGTPTAAGMWECTVEARNALGADRLALAFEVTDSVDAPSIFTSSLPGARHCVMMTALQAP